VVQTGGYNWRIWVLKIFAAWSLLDTPFLICWIIYRKLFTIMTFAELVGPAENPSNKAFETHRSLTNP
jgi:hypothetical protein